MRRNSGNLETKQAPVTPKNRESGIAGGASYALLWYAIGNGRREGVMKVDFVQGRPHAYLQWPDGHVG